MLPELREKKNSLNGKLCAGISLSTKYKCFDIIYVFIFPHHFNNNHNNLLFNNQLFFIPFLLYCVYAMNTRHEAPLYIFRVHFINSMNFFFKNLCSLAMCVCVANIEEKVKHCF